jgi:DmsE family decaheme c-type cytochrome
MNTRAAIILLALAAAAVPGGARAADAKPKAGDAKQKAEAKPKAEAKAKTEAKPKAEAKPKVDAKLKLGARGQLCLGCHVDFEAALKKQFVHTPVQSRDCAGCHNPHASAHGKLLATEPGKVCMSCHDVVPKDAKSTHAPIAAEKGCAACHDPHASAFKANLAKGGNDLCAGCHAKVTERAAKVKNKHRPVEQGCVTCHDPHGSAKGPALLKADVPELCVGCHKTSAPIFAKKHVDYDVSKARCTACHDPHGSDMKDILYEKVHAPVAKAMCAQCHEPAGTPNALKTKLQGAELCNKCHASTLNQLAEKGRVHRPVMEGQACLNCHNPHASKAKGLLKDGMGAVCGTCHADTIQRQNRAPTKHQPIADFECTSCHDPHAGTSALMFKAPDVISVCATCHDWQKHSSHPVGAKIVDPRNKNLRLDCLSCHRAHGTEFKKMLPAPKVTDLCTKCHDKYKR